MLADSPLDLVNDDLFISLDRVSDRFKVHLKIEGLSVTGSIKVKAAAFMLRAIESSGALRPDSRIIESSSGNLGVALAMACAAKGYRFTCVSDPNISPMNARLVRAYGAELVVVDRRDANDGYLGTRLQFIRDRLAVDPALIWVNQYENVFNVEAHYQATGRQILERFPRPDHVFIGAGTTGTLGGVSRRIREFAPGARIVAVDTQGSVTFGGPPGKRHIPGLGTSAPPAIRSHSSFDQMVFIHEADTVATCREFARHGLLLGGSTGTVLAAIRKSAHTIAPGACVVAISPDLGERYLDTIYDDEWCDRHFGRADRPAREQVIA